MKTAALSIIFILTSAFLPAQDTIYFDAEGLPAEGWFEADTYTVLEPDEADTSRMMATTYFLDGSVRSLCTYADFPDEKSGPCRVYGETGQVIHDTYYYKDKLHGNVMSFYPSGQRKRVDVFDNDTLVAGTCYSQTGKRTEHYPFRIYPRFPKGDQGLSKSLPENILLLEDANMEDARSVKVIYYVGLSGKTRIIDAISENREAAEIMRKVFAELPDWEPGSLEGRPEVFVMQKWFQVNIEE